MNEPTEVEQICQVGLATLFSEHAGPQNAELIAECVVKAYRDLRSKAHTLEKILVNVTQTISTELVPDVKPGCYQLVYIIILVGTGVDAEFIKQQQRMQQFNPAQQFGPRK